MMFIAVLVMQPCQVEPGYNRDWLMVIISWIWTIKVMSVWHKLARQKLAQIVNDA
jgi:hypothetical protein